ncbi:MAG: hypothetical protein PHP31_04200 [Lentimicrobiaceae bacterium]|nr:hypothetical protein [Lentimicrobiaceae bacterium]
MKKIGLFTVVIFLSGLLFGQDFGNILIQQRSVTCSDISYNSGLYFVKYMKENKLDSANYLLQYWESKCGMREPIYRAKILLALKQNQYHDSLLNIGTLSNILNYQKRMDMIKYSNSYYYDYSEPYYGYTPPGQEFDKYTQELSKSLMKNYQTEQIEYLLTEFYGENYDTIFPKIQSGIYGENRLTTEYENIVNKYVNMAEFHLSWITGVWIPTGKLKKLGLHPEIGFQMGAKHKKMNYDFTLTIRPVKSPNYYEARIKQFGDSIISTNYFFGAYVGFDVGRDLFSRNGHEMQLTGGIALDGFDVLDVDKDEDIKGVSVLTYNLNMGIGYRYYITNSFYLGLRTKYNIVDYSMNKVIDFTGNPITIQFIIGGVGGTLRNDYLRELKYNKMRR